MFKKYLLKTAALVTCAAMVLSGPATAFAAGETAGAPDTGASGDQIVAAPDTGAVPTEISGDANGETTGEQETPSEAETSETPDTQDTELPEKPFTDYRDAQNHWAKAALRMAYEEGILKGFEDGTMRPDDKITGAQMITILTRILNTAEKADVSGVLPEENCWYAEPLAEALALGILSPDAASGINNKMLRKEACGMMADAFQLTQADGDQSKAAAYSDFAGLTKAEKILFASLVNQEYLQGYGGSLMLASDITRAEFITLLYRVVGGYAEGGEIADYSTLHEGIVVSGKDFAVKDTSLAVNLWADASAETVTLEKVTGKTVVIRSDALTRLRVKDVTLDRLVLAAREGRINLDCDGIAATVVGDGGGTVGLSPDGNNVEITGDGRNVSLDERTGTVAISGNNNTITLLSSADAAAVKVYGTNNTVKIDSDVTDLIVEGKGNTISGRGSADHAVIYTATSQINIPVDEVTDRIDYGIKDMTGTIAVPAKVVAGSNLTATLNLVNIAEGKTVAVEWFVDGKSVKKENVSLKADSKPTLSYYLGYWQNMPDVSKVSCTVRYTTYDEENQVMTAPEVTVAVDKESAAFYQNVVNSVPTKYRGNYTTQWAIDHNLSNGAKEIFVNYKGYSSSSQYLIWVNIGTQYTSVFQGSKGNWRLIRSGLVSTGAGDCTPRGVFRTTYKQTNWTTDSYTVRPVVRFYGGGYAMHSRLYKPGTTTLKGGSNGVGYPLSHGCVRMQADDIQWIYDNVPNGTTIVVY